eukprot:CAMPEP_0113888842 /NCGR_PEP_ID=MMETSP0780_2-20120614/13118_1 /TAXON_ID=652834 /ORGANISM="Palpitomonas bilix" /LENGTH=330 /DNA_ID=CAMNT_0000877779 /DNA_START=404 /DNA_END=1396 /DNA_ORIENTATION=+ /assembly_acc=CAM_ASM_000599
MTAPFARKLIGHHPKPDMELKSTFENGCLACDKPLPPYDPEECYSPGTCHHCKVVYCRCCNAFVETSVLGFEDQVRVLEDHQRRCHPEKELLEYDERQPSFTLLQRCKRMRSVYPIKSIRLAFDKCPEYKNKLLEIGTQLDEETSVDDLFPRDGSFEQGTDDPFESSEQMVTRFLFPHIPLSEFAFATYFEEGRWKYAICAFGLAGGVGAVCAKVLPFILNLLFGVAGASVGSTVAIGAAVGGFFFALYELYQILSKWKVETTAVSNEGGGGLARRNKTNCVMLTRKPVVSPFSYIFERLAYLFRGLKNLFQKKRSSSLPNCEGPKIKDS